MDSQEQTTSLPDSELTYEHLAEIEATQPRNEETPEALRLDQIRVAEQVFQPRVGRGNLLDDTHFVPVLVEELRRNQGRPLEAVLVTAIGPDFFCVDGHHRLAAYEQFGWTEPVPVRVFEGSLVEAFVQSWTENRRPKLSPSRSDRTEWAWRLVQLEKFSKHREQELTGCSEGTIAKMRRALKHEGNIVRGQPWWWVLRRENNKEAMDVEEWQEQQAQQVAQAVVKHTGVKLARNPEVLARAIYLINDGLPALLMEIWRGQIELEAALEQMDI
ncbi:hypothetical protein M446_4957 [Methylobacterium sp. 4-46]|uniref:hypothetical protein n=1 Tax=unclassified Methylobacterium TaxID=2615210 RepID=UPI000165CB5C|nr:MULTISPECIES: hypothetical protein [Methylobacterium]ACA19286.1 hypothetical protein M446_4957 [Methylobacterium sp. 4-46]WFT78487.1 hypothetical protein QA634_24905 [Methylobacterium nodulans]